MGVSVKSGYSGAGLDGTGDNRGNKQQEFTRTNKKEIDNDGHDAPESIDSEDMTRVDNDSQQEERGSKRTGQR
jgi:hypothetical protein